jgi:hypothetical protein
MPKVDKFHKLVDAILDKRSEARDEINKLQEGLIKQFWEGRMQVLIELSDEIAKLKNAN